MVTINNATLKYEISKANNPTCPFTYIMHLKQFVKIDLPSIKEDGN